MERKSIVSDRYDEQLKDFVDFISRACAFTGHRPHKLPWRGDEAASACVALKEVLTAQIDALVKNGYTDFFLAWRREQTLGRHRPSLHSAKNIPR